MAIFLRDFRVTLHQVDDLHLGELDFEQFLELVLKRTDSNLVSVFRDMASAMAGDGWAAEGRVLLGISLGSGEHLRGPKRHCFGWKLYGKSTLSVDGSDGKTLENHQI